MLTIAERQEAIQLLRVATDEIAAEVVHLSVAQLTTPYLANEWTVAQNVHHLPDAHSYAINNLRLVLSEDKPTWKSYNPDGFAQIADAREADISVSLDLMRAMHIRWVRMLESKPWLPPNKTTQSPPRTNNRAWGACLFNLLR